MNKKNITILSVIILLALVGTLFFGWRAGWFGKKETVTKEERLAKISADPSSIVLSSKYKHDQIVSAFTKYRSGNADSMTDEDWRIYLNVIELGNIKYIQNEQNNKKIDSNYSLFDSNGESIDLGIFTNTNEKPTINNSISIKPSDFSLGVSKASPNSLYDNTKDIDLSTNFYKEIIDDPFLTSCNIGYYITLMDSLSVDKMAEILSIFAPGDIRYVKIDGNRLYGLPNSEGKYSVKDELMSYFPTKIITIPRIEFVVSSSSTYNIELKNDSDILLNILLSKIKSVTGLSREDLSISMSDSAGFSFNTIRDDLLSSEDKTKIDILSNSIIDEISNPKYSLNLGGTKFVKDKYDISPTEIKDIKDVFKEPGEKTFQLYGFSVMDTGFPGYFRAINKMVSDYNSENPTRMVFLGMVGGSEFVEAPFKYFRVLKDSKNNNAMYFSPSIPRKVIKEIENNVMPKIFEANNLNMFNVKIFFSDTRKANAGYSQAANAILVSKYLLDNNSVYIHELTHSVWSSYTIFLSNIINEGYATTVAEYFSDYAAKEDQYNNRVISAHDNIESINIPSLQFSQLSGDSVNIYKPSPSDYEWGANLVSKLYLENPKILGLFIASFKKNVDNLSAENKSIVKDSSVLKLSLIYDALKNSMDTIENVKTIDWLNNQFYLHPSSFINNYNPIYIEGRQALSFTRGGYGDVYSQSDTNYIYSQNLKINNDSVWEVKFLNFNAIKDNSYKIELFGKINGKDEKFGETSVAPTDFNKNQAYLGFQPLLISRYNFNSIPVNYNGILRFVIKVNNPGKPNIFYDQYFYSSDSDVNIAAIVPEAKDEETVYLNGHILDKCIKNSPEDLCLRTGVDSGTISNVAVVKNGIAVFNDINLLNSGKFTINLNVPSNVSADQSGKFKINNVKVSKTFNKIYGSYATIIYPNLSQCGLRTIKNKNLVSFVLQSSKCKLKTNYFPVVMFQDVKKGFVKEKCSLGEFCKYIGNDSIGIKALEYFYPKDLQLIK